MSSVTASIGGTADYKNDYLYDNANRLTRITQQGQSGGNAVAEKRVGLNYNDANQWDTITRYADVAGTDLVATTTYGYDPGIGRLASIDHGKGVTALAGYDYDYDLAGRIEQIDSLLDGITTYAHDDRGQLTEADHASIADEVYAYDDNGNRSGGDYVTDANNLTIEDANFTYAYDDEGNRVLRTGKTTGEKLEYTWDYRNRLVAVTYKTDADVVTKKVVYEYDAFDRRVRKRVDDTGNGSWDRGEQYVYDGDHIALVFDDSGTLIRRNLHGEAIDQIFASEFVATNETSWYLTDHLGTVRDVYSYDDVLDDIVNEGHIEYDSFGNIVAGLSVAERAQFAYTGREWDADAQLYYYRARWYDPVLGQFLSHDPIGFMAGDANLGRYVGNLPTMFVDPFGLAEKPWWDATRPGGINDTLSAPFRWMWNNATNSATPNRDFYLQENRQIAPTYKDVGLPSAESEEMQRYREAEDRKREAELARTPKGRGILEREARRREISRQIGELITSTCPVWSDIRDIKEVGTGKDYTTGEPLTDYEWDASVKMMILPGPSGKHARMVDRALNARRPAATIAEDAIKAKSYPHNLGPKNSPKAPLGRGSTANIANGTSLPRNLREKLAIQEALAKPWAGQELALPLGDKRWHNSNGWVKMEYVVECSGREGSIRVHYVLNKWNGHVDDFKIVLQGRR